jgi:hypothetical protein
MIEPPSSKFQWGQRVSAVSSQFNDGSHPDFAPDALPVAAGPERASGLAVAARWGAL